MALFRERRFKKEEVLVWCSTLMADEAYPRIGKSFHSDCMLWSTECWCKKGHRVSAFSFCLPCWPFVWFQRKWWPGRLCVASSSDWLFVLCCPLTVINVTSGEGPFQSVFVSLSRWPVDNSPYSMIFGRRWSSILETRHVLPSEAVFWGACPRCW